MAISMNIHNVASIVPGEIYSGTCSDGETHYWRDIEFFDTKGQRIFSVTTHTDYGYNLLISDPVIDDMNAELPLLQAA